MDCFALAKKRQPRELRREEKLHEEEWLSFCPPLPLARELKVVRCDANESHGCELRRSPGLAVAPGLFDEDRCGAFPRCHSAKERLAAVACALTESALQSRGRDGFIPFGSEEAGTGNPASRARRSPWTWS